MTAAEWEACTDLETMLKAVRRREIDRKLLLFACGCLRRIWHLLPDRRNRQLIEVAEQHADGRGRPTAIADAIRKARGLTIPDLAGNRGRIVASNLSAWLRGEGDVQGHLYNALSIAHAAAGAVAYHTFHTSGVDRGGIPAYQMPIWLAAEAAEASVQRDLLRCVLGNPIRRRVPLLHPDWLTWHDGLLVSLTQRMYDTRDFTEMPVLADMLEDAGCCEALLLAHCRGPGPHARGCFVADLILVEP